MSGNPAVVMRLVASAYAVAEKAGTGANDLQTLADRLVQQSICAPLSKSFPKITIIGEEDLPEEAVKEDLIESSQSEEILQLVVWVDPLDGTKEYTEGKLTTHDSPYGDTVLIGISYGGKAIAGVINQPFFNYQLTNSSFSVLGTETADMWGMPGLGAFGFELQEVPDGRRIVTMTRSQSNKLVTDTVDAMVPHDVISWYGGACVFASLGTKKWGTCAPEAILHALGGKLTDMHGSALCYDANVKHINSAGVLATLRNLQYYTSTNKCPSQSCRP
uniref:3'(2'),5'-bisphosphate nucleotidase n=1 Tax=Oncorhynchus mykiss TaxID=8022 RepID=A0A8C7PIK3_ONCMY